ncbi:MAG: hypothetical protein IRY98_12005 [Alicyclobacillaceae bacterium]|nr:hypothetical protein [Alicyclobacillaceae bacterium]
MEHPMAPTLLPILQSLVGKVVRINKGPEGIIGKLLAVQSDYLVVEPIDEHHKKDGEKSDIVFFQIHHIKSIREEPQQEEAQNSDQEESQDKNSGNGKSRKRSSAKKKSGRKIDRTLESFSAFFSL